MADDWFLGMDGDNVGRMVEHLLIEERLLEASALSRAIAAGIEAATRVAETDGLTVYFSGGDGLFAGATSNCGIGEIAERLIATFKSQSNGLTATCGVGRTAPEVILALRLGKARGGDQVQWYVPVSERPRSE